MIHATAIIDPRANVDPTVQVGPYAVIDADVEIGPGCLIGPHVYVTGLTRIGARNQLFAGCVVGEAPQDVKYAGEPTGVRIGEGNIFREHTTIHRSSKVGLETVIGSYNLLMANSHVGHNSEIGDRVVIANGALLGGYVTIADRAFVSGNCLLHQFVRVGTLALMQGGSAISKDLPPYTIARGDNAICGLNTIGLRRAGMQASERLELRQAYHAIFRAKNTMKKAVEQAGKQYSSAAVQELVRFIRESKRGVCFDVGAMRGNGDEEASGAEAT